MVKRLQAENGMTLVELLIAMLVMTIGIFAIVAVFSSGLLGINRAGSATVAGAIADQKMEAYRQASYGSIAVSLIVPPASYPAPTSVTGSDGRTYKAETYVRWACVDEPSHTPPACTGSAGEPVKLVTITVCDGSAAACDPTTTQSYVQGHPMLLFRANSTFDSLTG